MPKSQNGFIAPIGLLLAIFIIATSAFALKNLGLDEVQPDPNFSFKANQISQIPSPSSSPAKNKPQVATTKSPTPTAKTNQSESSTSNSNQESSGNSNQSSNTQTSSNATPTPSNSATSSPIPTATPTPEPQTVSTASNDGITVTMTCSGNNLTASIVGDIKSPNDRNQGLWSTLVDNSNGQSMIYEYNGNQGSSTIHIAANIPPSGAIRGTSISVVGDGRSFSVKVYAAPFTYGTPNLSNQVAQVDFSKNCSN